MGMISRNTALNTIGVSENPTPDQVKAAVKVSTAPPLDLKTKQIQRQGMWQAAASNPALLGYAADVDALKLVVRELAEDGIKFVNEG
jgi:hypothetical protein